MMLRKNFVFITLLLLPLIGFAKIDVLFHPQDPTLEAISSWIEESHTVDIAMYNMDVTDKSPIIQMFMQPSTQERIKSGNLNVRLLFEGYGTPEANSKKMQALEDLGINVRFLGYAVKVHHKFAVLDSNSNNPRLITGSANWSLSSASGYNENILFVSNEAELSGRFQVEFNRLWQNAQEFGATNTNQSLFQPLFLDDPEIQVYFNSPRSLPGENEGQNNLTEELIEVINRSQYELLIATTRARIIPALEALVAAADRGVKVSILLNQDDYRDLYKRSKYLLGHPNIETRVKFFNLVVNDYLAYQMHNKFLISDRNLILTGSFNWSKSSENNHIENLIKIEGSQASEVLPKYLQEFSNLWNLGRTDYDALLFKLQQAKWSQCAIPAMSLTPDQIWELLKWANDCKK